METRSPDSIQVRVLSLKAAHNAFVETKDQWHLCYVCSRNETCVMCVVKRLLREIAGLRVLAGEFHGSGALLDLEALDIPS